MPPAPNNQRKSDMARLKTMMASGRQVPNADDLAFMKALMSDTARLPKEAADRLRPLVAKWL